jgi:hypothetical protein
MAIRSGQLVRLLSQRQPLGKHRLASRHFSARDFDMPVGLSGRIEPRRHDDHHVRRQRFRPRISCNALLLPAWRSSGLRGKKCLLWIPNSCWRSLGLRILVCQLEITNCDFKLRWRTNLKSPFVTSRWKPCNARRAQHHLPQFFCPDHFLPRAAAFLRCRMPASCPLCLRDKNCCQLRSRHRPDAVCSEREDGSEGKCELARLRPRRHFVIVAVFGDELRHGDRACYFGKSAFFIFAF